MRRFLCQLLMGLIVCAATVAWADGIPEGGGPGGQTPGTGPAVGSGATPPASTGAWPPKTPTKGTFVPDAFVGTWYAFTANTAFTLKLEQDGTIVKGAHYAVFDYGRRIDSSNGTISIVGTVNGSVAYVEWKSGLGTEAGRATIEVQQGKPPTIYWMIADPPKKTDSQAGADAAAEEMGHYLPRAAYLLRK